MKIPDIFWIRILNLPAFVSEHSVKSRDAVIFIFQVVLYYYDDYLRLVGTTPSQTGSSEPETES